jgi:hypothetical protein
MKLKVILILTLCLIIPTVAYAARKKAKPMCGATSFNDCPTEGCGGDPLLNEKKNRVDQPEASDIEKVTRTRFANLGMND